MVSALTAGGWLGVVFFATYIGWLFSELIGAVIVPRLRGSARGEKSRADRGSRLSIFLGIIVSIIILNIFAQAGLTSLSLDWVELGILLIVVGVVVRQYAIAVLGRFFNTSVRSVVDHRVVRAGPYRFVRHPSYTGALISLIGLGLASGSWEGLLTILLIAAVVFGYRIHVEEHFLLDQLGEEYANYRSETNYLVPFLL